MTDERPLTTAEVQTALGISQRLVYRWIAQGCPSTRVISERGGPRRRRFLMSELLPWLEARGFTPRTGATVPRPVSRPASADAPPPPAADGPDVATLRRLVGTEGFVTRLQEAERFAWAHWRNAAGKKGSDPTGVTTSTLQRRWLELGEALRHAERDSPRIAESAGSVVPIAEVRPQFARLATEVKQALEAVPRAIAPRLVGLPAAQVEVILTEELDGVLRLLEHGPTEREAEQ